MRVTSDKQLKCLGSGEFPIADVPGLSVRVSPRGLKSFRLRYRIFPETKQYSMPIGRYPDVKLKDATSQARIALGEAARGRDPAAAIRRARAKPEPEFYFAPLVDQFGDEWCMANHKPRPAREKVHSLHREWGRRANFAKVDVRNITAEMVVKHLSAIRASGRHDANDLSNLKSFFKWLHGRRIVTTIPTDGVRHNSKSRPRARYLNNDETKSIWQAADEVGYPFGHIIKLLLLTATRKEEVGGMRWSEIDYTAAEWTIPHERTKKQFKSIAQPHLVPLSKPALELLRSVPQLCDEYVFPGQRGDKSIADWDKRKDALDKLSGVKDYTIHDLRRTAVTGLGRLKVPPHIKRALLHHSSRDVLDLHYDQFEYVDEKRDALERWADYLMEVAYA
ncbi:MAG: integrase arm-type DNA-binding domain-containing protein [Pseudomonadota bacterium]